MVGSAVVVTDDLVRQYGLQPFGAKSPAADFRLPDLFGGESALSDYQGSWVILTFWASWCGPCRAEMPSLEHLHRQRGDQGLAVVGVSLDTSIDAARQFAEEMDLTFPLLWDDEGSVASDYRAHAIPMSYVIDPNGGLVGIATGARDWSQSISLFDALLALDADDLGEGAGYLPSGSVGVPEVLDPPTAELRLSTPEPMVGEEFELEIRLHWAGTLEEYLPQTPKVHLPEGVTQIGVEAASDSRAGSRIVTYRAALMADDAGAFALDPVELRYTTRFSSGPVTSRIVGPTVVVRERTIAGMPPRNLALAVGSFVLVAVLGLVAIRRWRGDHAPSSVSEEPSFEALTGRLQQVKTLRMQGDAKGAVLALVDLARAAGSDCGLNEDGLDSLEEGARYGGLAPSKEKFDQYQRVVERRLQAIQPDPAASARGSLRLRTKDD